MTTYGRWQNPLTHPQPPDTRPIQQEDPLPPTARADFHFLYVAPGLSVDYFFDAARRFWQTFRVIVVNDLTLIEYIPRRYSVAITTLARSDNAGFVADDIATRFGARVYHDPLVYDFIEDMTATLDLRADRNEPFGVPLAQ